MKKLIIAIIIIVIIISAIVVSLITASRHFIADFLNDQKFLEQDEIIEIFEGNREHFLNVKNSMSEFRYDWDICKNGDIISGWKTSRIKGGLYLSVRSPQNYEQMDVMKQAIEDKPSTEYILKELGFKKIAYSGYADAKHIRFVKHASTGNVAGILYCIEGGPESEDYANIIVDLGDGWYYYATR